LKLSGSKPTEPAREYANINRQKAVFCGQRIHQAIGQLWLTSSGELFYQKFDFRWVGA
jgi:hypothetical protein